MARPNGGGKTKVEEEEGEAEEVSRLDGDEEKGEDLIALGEDLEEQRRLGRGEERIY